MTIGLTANAIARTVPLRRGCAHQRLPVHQTGTTPFSDPENAAGLLRSYLPQELVSTLRWSTLTHLPGRYVSDDWRGREADLLFSVERADSGPPALVYVLLEHQSTPDRWMPLRLLHYCLMVWMDWHRDHEQEPQLPLIVPVVFYQGAEPWRFPRQFAELVAGAEPDRGWVPRFEHLLIDQTEQNPESVEGTPGARLAQLAFMAEFRRAGREELFNQLVRLVEAVSGRRIGRGGAARGVRAAGAEVE